MVQGSLENFGLLEVLQFVGKKSGVLIVDSEEGTLHIYVRNGNVVGVDFNGERVSNLFVVRGIVFRFLKSTRGEFRYVPGEPEVSDFSVPVETFVLSVVTFKDELNGLRIANPVHPDTVYEIAGENGELPPPLRDFVTVARPHLVRGASSRNISVETGLTLETVQRYLAVLESLGYVRPKVIARSKASPGLIDRAIRFLKRFWKWPR